MESKVIQFPKSELRQLRGDRPLQEVAAAVSVPVSAIDAYERGLRVPSDEGRLARYYGRSVFELFFKR